MIDFQRNMNGCLLMLSDEGFQELLTQLRDGDEQAITQFVTEYEPYIRRALRSRIARANLHAAADSADVCQSALCSFLIGLANREYQFNSRDDLEKMLFTIVRRKFAVLVRREYADRRDRNRLQPMLTDQEPPGPVTEEPPARVIYGDFLDQVKRRLPTDMRDLFTLRQEGKSWEEISRTHHEDAALLRKRLSRALHRVTIELGLESEG